MLGIGWTNVVMNEASGEHGREGFHPLMRNSAPKRIIPVKNSPLGLAHNSGCA